MEFAAPAIVNSELKVVRAYLIKQNSATKFALLLRHYSLLAEECFVSVGARMSPPIVIWLPLLETEFVATDEYFRTDSAATGSAILQFALKDVFFDGE